MIITLEQLKLKSACSPALKEFEKVVGQQTADIEINPAAQGWILASRFWRRFLGWAWNEGIIPMWSMREVNLSIADLSIADLRRANLSETDLSQADLSNADLSKADLRGVDLRETKGLPIT